jgi:hypothetical protein
MQELVEAAVSNPLSFSSKDSECLNNLDAHLTKIMFSAECLCAKKRQTRQPWSPKQRLIARTFLIGSGNSLCPNKDVLIGNT